MKSSTAALSIATLSLAMLTPGFAQVSSTDAPNGPVPGAAEAQHMVPARASLDHTLDAGHLAPGAQFRATLTDTVHLQEGVELHRGDILLGQVVNDDLNLAGRSHLAVRFTEAVRKGGQNVPIKATIIALYGPGDLMTSDFGGTQQIPNNWNNAILTVDQMGALHDVDLHSRIASENSGVFVSTQRDDIKIPAGSEIALAIAPAATPAP